MADVILQGDDLETERPVPEIWKGRVRFLVSGYRAGIMNYRFWGELNCANISGTAAL